jgi:hypothetical protein
LDSTFPIGVSKRTADYLETLAPVKRYKKKFNAIKDILTNLTKLFQERPIWLRSPLNEHLFVDLRKVLKDPTVTVGTHVVTDTCRDFSFYFKILSRCLAAALLKELGGIFVFCFWWTGRWFALPLS